MHSPFESARTSPFLNSRTLWKAFDGRCSRLRGPSVVRLERWSRRCCQRLSLIRNWPRRFSNNWLLPRREAAAVALQDAIRSGQLRADLTIPETLDILYGGL